MDWFFNFPDMSRSDLREFKKTVDFAFTDFSRTYGQGIEDFFEPLLMFLVWFEKLFINTPWPIIIFSILLLAWIGSRSILIVVGTIRELLGSGQLLGIDILTTTQNGGWYVGNNFFLLAPSSFLIIGLFIWALRSWKTEQVEEKEFLMSKNAPKEVETHHA